MTGENVVHSVEDLSPSHREQESPPTDRNQLRGAERDKKHNKKSNDDCFTLFPSASVIFMKSHRAIGEFSK